jgi:hypothetical protein
MHEEEVRREAKEEEVMWACPFSSEPSLSHLLPVVSF